MADEPWYAAGVEGSHGEVEDVYQYLYSLKMNLASALEINVSVKRIYREDRVYE